MSRILIAWELGGGGGHVEMLMPVIERLLADGHELSIAARDLFSTARRLGDLPVRLLPAPHWQGRSSLPPACSYAETLMRVGYADSGLVRTLAVAWLGLIELSGCDRLVVEHAPGALLAARIAGVPTVVLGTGFTLPPPSEPMPALAMPQPPPPQRLRDGEAHVLRAMNHALAHHGAAELASLAHLFDCEASFLCTVEELDHHGARAGARYWGAITRETPADEPRWPAGSGERVFAYMHPGYGHFRALLEQLAALRQPVLVIAPGIPDGVLDSLQQASLKVGNRPVDLARVAERCRVVVTHGGHGILASLLGLGMPPVLAPAYVEQSVMAWRLAQQGLAVLAGSDPASYRYAPAIERVLGDHAIWRRVAAFAERHPPAGAAGQRAALQAAAAEAVAG